jgi:hypothetical protein
MFSLSSYHSIQRPPRMTWKERWTSRRVQVHYIHRYCSSIFPTHRFLFNCSPDNIYQRSFW